MRSVIFLLVFLLVSIPLVVSWALDVEGIIAKSSYSDEEKIYLKTQVGAIIQEVEGRNLPVSFLLSKMKEGVGKRVSPYKLVEVLEKRKSALFEAQEILDKVEVEEKTRDKILTNLALSIEFSIPVPLLENVLQEIKKSDPRNLPRVVESISALLEVGVSSEKIERITGEIVSRGLKSKEIGKIASLLERSRRDGVDVERTMAVLEEALRKYDNFNLVEMEVRQFLASTRRKPSLSSGEGVVSTSPGISGTTPVQEGGGPLESSSSGHPPLQEGGGPLE